MLLCRWPVPTHPIGCYLLLRVLVAVPVLRSSSSINKVSETGHGGADARSPLPESVLVTAVMQIPPDGLGEYVGKGRRFGPTGNAMQGPLTATTRYPVACLVNAPGRSLHRQIVWVTGLP